MATDRQDPVRDVRWVGSDAVVDARGEIDLHRSVEFQQEMLRVLDRRPGALVVNLSRVPYMDSSGVASLVKVLSRARTQGIAMSLVELTPRVRSVFEITRLDSVFDIYTSEEEALSAR